mmetsp:Transcript_12365/g.16769  ORF Transcript_12365/g.16769 Transcript_12365/m.16769 type:complete len:269 (+) Transcript_12365:22-828(+)
METNNQKKIIGVAVYELLGTSLMMYAMMLFKGDYGVATGLSATLMFLAWDVSGGHFNPAITLGMFMADLKNAGKNLVIMLIMIVAQFAGAFLGIFWGWLAIVNKLWQDKIDSDYSVPSGAVGEIGPTLPGNAGIDHGDDPDNGFTRDWQTFFAMFLTSMILVLAYASVKMPQTAISDNKVVQIIALTFIFTGLNGCNMKFGEAGINPALASGYIAFVASQHTDDEAYNHYLWAYMIGPLFGGALGGFLYLIHSRCAQTKGRDNSFTEI